MTIIQLRRGTSSSWTSANPILASGEPGEETDTGKLKIGDGLNPWVALPYVGGVAASDLTAERTASAVLQNKQINGAQNTITNLPASAISSGQFAPARLGTGGTGGGTKVLFDDNTFKAITGGGDALQASGLGQFASTSSTQFYSVLSTKTGAGLAVFGTGPNITAPTGIVKADVGLGNVDNTADTAKPISALQQAGLDTKATLGVFGRVLITSSRDLAAADIGLRVHNASGTNRTLTIQNTATSGIPWVPGKFFGASRTGTGTLSVAAGSGVTIINNDSLTVAQYAIALVFQMSETTDTWIVG